MFERFNERARNAVVIAQEESRGLGHGHIGVEHLLLGALRSGGAAELVLTGCGLREGELREAVARRLAPHGPAPGGQIPFTAAAQSSLLKAVRMADERGERQVSTLHLLLVLAEADELAGLLPGGIDEAIAKLPASALDEDRRGTVDPRDPGPPIAVRLEDRLIGDLGNRRTDARLLLAILLRDGDVAAWLHERGVNEAAVREEFGGLDLGFGS